MTIGEGIAAAAMVIAAAVVASVWILALSGAL
jgi:hypothetical protein